MKQIKKHLVWILCMALCLSVLTACSGQNEESGIALDAAVESEMQQFGQAFLESIVETPVDQRSAMAEQLEYYYGSGFAAGVKKAWENLDSIQGDLGAFVAADSVTVLGTEDGFDIAIAAQFEQRTCDVSVVIDESDMSVDITFNPAYTVGENMAKAGMNTLMGMGTVFAVLIFISLLISCFKYISVFEANMKAKSAPAAPAAPAPAPVAAPAEPEDLTDDLELVAVITAAIAAASENVSADGLVVRSIRRVPGSKWKKA